MAMKNQDAAVATLRFRRPDSESAEFIIRGEATPEFVDWLDVEGRANSQCHGDLLIKLPKRVRERMSQH